MTFKIKMTIRDTNRNEGSVISEQETTHMAMIDRAFNDHMWNLMTAAISSFRCNNHILPEDFYFPSTMELVIEVAIHEANMNEANTTTTIRFDPRSVWNKEQFGDYVADDFARADQLFVRNNPA